MVNTSGKVLVTGAKGFLGQHLVKRLRYLGFEVVALGGRSSSSSRVDVCDLDAITALMKEVSPRFVVHLAAIRNRGTRSVDVSESISANVTGTANVTLSAAESGVEALVLAGTAEEYGSIETPFREDAIERPVTGYGVSKLLAGKAGLLCGATRDLAVTLLRIAVAYGPGQSGESLMGGLVESIVRGEPFRMSAGEQTRDFIWIEDVVDAMVRAIEVRAAGEIFNIGSGVSIRVAEAARQVSELAGRADLLCPGELPLRPGEALEYSMDIGKARAMLNWSPTTDFATGIRRMLAEAGL